MALSTNLGFPRIGKNREYKRIIESFWKGGITADQLHKDLEKIHMDNLATQIEAGLDFIPLGDFSAYDLMLETALMLGVVPKRFQNLSGWNRYYAMARGTQDVTACEMKKWFDTNYHYIVPEIEEGFTLKENRLTLFYQWATTKFPNKNFRPVLIGPFTFLKLSRAKNNKSFDQNLQQLAGVYQKIVSELAQTNCQWLQIDEPALCGDVTTEELGWLKKTYETLTSQKKSLKIMLQTYFGDVANIYSQLTALPVDGVGLDLVRGKKNLNALKEKGVPSEKWIGLGLIDGRNIWRSHLREVTTTLEGVGKWLDLSKAWIHPSCSLLHLPVSLETEDHIPTVLKKRLTFASERLKEISILTKCANLGAKAIESELKADDAVWTDKEFVSFALDKGVQERLKNLKPADFKRGLSFKDRYVVQQKDLGLPALPTTTIGSFPQTEEIRQARAKWKKGELTQSQYEQFIREEIGRVVKLQEEIGLDVLVHGEPERTDMVEYFAERLKGFQFTKNGWVQSYGTRCIRPPMIYGDISRPEPMTVKEAQIAQSFTKKPMKGMLTGPVTIVNWSFPRADVSKSTSAMQIGVALRDEVSDLEKAGIKVIQIDEPALREGLPLRKSDWADYLKWAVDSFKLSSSGVNNTTQIHTHMCYSEFSDILESIQALDADSLSIEDSRSLGKLAKGLAEMHYQNGMGPGVYDVHSEKVPTKEEFEKQIQFLVKHVPLNQLWINPDCGLKTRGYKEVTPALKNMVEAVKEVRKTL
ncbi:MAG: 5-methyltetrahydropteroyltriglutamate--homocysteine S-methyltransferase [Deltaproteobacteria bacterium RIFCSPLOWO2_12_FULL_44_12]|nr:MAG: 5-methyltetrahydropteroyltriglutamate--homocysteine S-methyltransferase [Deltaproteobacteria bacterium RIFCSPHIGHO2_01_FULL_43_49]OGQ15135.1 MAG: 5-methyltetrahydropteroyltriglutamate--homocysteine S-methyltransferase [Deltaproteobacteria bacterium RIFCSPHIGHO2_02_FULL_44_53]OGQ27244.1 MAG: 5-methyltetrahydropteroyltriglutamate--homocysteine S-methyltransferase [Deltaproteobacteria bacterium RIFCSPHIGHO2_12_FULL_44_21]OGQ31652.1 MAG: 5-methyltetrahydropteroyltriglutamate--homocysteine S-